MNSPVLLTLVWLSEDCESCYRMGQYTTRANAQAAIGSARKQLLGDCTTDEERNFILAGHFVIVP